MATLDHVGLNVGDLDAMTRWYAKALDLSVEFEFALSEAEFRGVMLHSPAGHRIELLHRAGNRAGRPATSPVDAHSAAKGGVVTLTKTAALEYARYGVRVNCICPGVIQTAMVERITGGTEAVMERLRRMQPFPRLGSAEDIARMALFLASDESEFVTGAAMTVDGGLTAR